MSKGEGKKLSKFIEDLNKTLTKNSYTKDMKKEVLYTLPLKKCSHSITMMLYLYDF